MQDLTLDRLAGAAGLSCFYFLRAFRSEIGVTPHAYLTGRRIAAAKRLLDGEHALSEVALAGGFYRSEEHTYEIQSLMRTSEAVFCLKKKTDLLCMTTHKNKSQ